MKALLPKLCPRTNVTNKMCFVEVKTKVQERRANGVERPTQERKKKVDSVDTSGIEPDTFRRSPERSAKRT
jgi:hypothetical protein